MANPDYEGVRRYVLEKLEKELPPNLYYHCLSHTRDEVIPAADQLLAMEKVDGNARLVLRTAALFHDVGYIEGVEGHEAVSVRIARQVLPGFGYTAGQVDSVCSLIMATRMPRTPHSLLEEILADADLDNLGRSDFMQRSLDLRKEWATFGRLWTDREWYISQLEFLAEHRYFTASARQLRGVQKLKNIQQLRLLLKH
ncbi:MAG: HD domain-containing protein [Anaerolineaceae bacterium]|jgi:uncharacterized protein